jgi:NAD(P)-dependent dehydrogenase (short-subunit alcohol dehydrogenase family)
MGADERGASPVALVTGANRGIGFEMCRQLARPAMKVVLCARDLVKAKLAAKKLSGEGLNILPHTVDVSEGQSVEKSAAWFEEESGLGARDGASQAPDQAPTRLKHSLKED